MKFFVALFALVAVAQAGVIPHAVLSAPITQYSSIPAAHLVAHAAPVSWAHQVSAHHVLAPQPLVYSAPLAHASWDDHSHVVHAAPQVLAHSHVIAAPQVLAHSHVVAAPAAHVVAVPAAAKYTAVTRGAVHEAPLEGHAISQTSLNLAPAPGTL